MMFLLHIWSISLLSACGLKWKQINSLVINVYNLLAFFIEKPLEYANLYAVWPSESTASIFAPFLIRRSAILTLSEEPMSF